MLKRQGWDEALMWCPIMAYTSNKQMHCLPITQTGEVRLHKGDEISKLATVMSAIIHSQRQKF